MPKAWLRRLGISDRRQRIIARRVFGRPLPEFVYRMDGRPPDEMLTVGFQPHSAEADDWGVTIIEHVENRWMADRPEDPSGRVRDARPVQNSHWVSTGSYRFVKELDGLITGRARESWLYKIRTSAAQSREGRVEFFYVNGEFDAASRENSYRGQREWIKLGGIAPAAIVGSMHGRLWTDQWQSGAMPDDEARFGPWTPL